MRSTKAIGRGRLQRGICRYSCLPTGMKSILVALFGVMLTGQVAQAAPAQPKWQWLFDEADSNATTMLDTGSAGASANGTLQGAVHDVRSASLTPFSYSGNKSFVPGSARYASIPLSASLGTQSTVSLWVRLDTAFPEVGNSWVLNATSSGAPLTAVVYYDRLGKSRASRDEVWWNGAYKGEDNITHGGAITALPDGVWRHLVLVRDGENVDIWEGDLGSSLTKVWTLVLPAALSGATTFDTLYVGAHSSGLANVFPGQIDELAIWDTALSSADLEWLHSNSLNSIPEPAGMALLTLAMPLMRRRRVAA